MLADHSKFDKHGIFEVAPLQRINRIVTDRAPSMRIQKALAASGVDLIVSADMTAEA